MEKEKTLTAYPALKIETEVVHATGHGVMKQLGIEAFKWIVSVGEERKEIFGTVYGEIEVKISSRVLPPTPTK